MDPDGRLFRKPNFSDMQNTKEHINVHMGDAGLYDVDDNGKLYITKYNTIYRYGCLFTECMNNANSERQKYCEQHNIKFKKSMISDFAPLNKFYEFTPNDNNPYETDSNMSSDTFKLLYETVAGKKINHLLRVTKKTTITALLFAIQQSNKEVTVIGHCKGHYFTILGVNSDGSLNTDLIQDPQDPTKVGKKWYAEFENELKTKGVDQLWIID